MTDPQSVLVLSPHTDDGELGAGGTISKLMKSERDIYYVAFSSCDESLPPEQQGLLQEEFERVMSVVQPEEYYLFDYTVRRFNERRQDILEQLVEIREALEPDLVIGPSLSDAHQDHTIVAEEMVRAFKTNAGIITYELPWNHMTFETELFYQLDSEDVESKLELLSLYESQTELKDRPYFREEFVRGLAAVRGVQCNATYAEAFNVIRWQQ